MLGSEVAEVSRTCVAFPIDVVIRLEDAVLNMLKLVLGVCSTILSVALVDSIHGGEFDKSHDFSHAMWTLSSRINRAGERATGEIQAKGSL